jgi:exopolyphosphatase/guanosine-5'-triphosphate,3'-diphosphate pyrophosphatase
MASLAVPPVPLSVPASPLVEPGDESPRIGIIDIGSNSVRLVVYRGLTRTPAILFNEKVMAGLGRGLSAGGALSEEAMAVAITALARFAQLADAMAVDSLRAVGTAAIREASNGPAFVARVRAETGLAIEVIDGETEAHGAALGVIAAIPDADGIVGDLGGGSLELVRVAHGRIHERLSLPLGALRLDALRKGSRRALAARIGTGLDALHWAEAGRGRPFYAVGGSWRALAQLHMHLTGWPLPVIHHYVMPADAPDRLVRTLARISLKSLKDVPALSASRAPQLPGAAALLKAVTRRLESSCIIASAYGLREGLLFQALSPEVQREDPLIAGARDIAVRTGRFSDGSDADVGHALLAFTDGLFTDEAEDRRRIRHAAALLADCAWRAHPDMRAEHALDTALHGTWVGIDAEGRAMLAAALFVANGGAPPGPATAVLERLASPATLELARRWGLALRLGNRLAGGTAQPLAAAALAADPRFLWLSLGRASAALYGEAVQRRHRALAQALGLEPRLRLLPG